MLKILGYTAQNIDAEETWRPKFMHHWFAPRSKLSITESQQDTEICILP